jgi:hypothetical protein
MPDFDSPTVRTRSYYYRRPLGVAELLPAVGVAVGVGLAAFYVARLLIQRTPLVPPPPGPHVTRARRRVPSAL